MKINSDTEIVTFSIITVTYNDCPGLKQTYETIKDQTFKKYEWIVIDGNSKDNTVDFLSSKLGINVTWISEEDNGIYDAMNKGLKKSTGQYLVFLNAGDLFPDSNTLKKISDYILSQKQLPDVVLGGATFLLPNGLKNYKYPKEADTYIWHGVPANHQATYFRKRALNDTLYDIQYKICGDYYIVAKMYAQKSVFSCYNETLVLFKVGGASYTNIFTLWKESYLIKKRVLNVPFLIRLKSLTKSMISTVGLIILSQNSFRWLGKLILSNGSER